MPKLRLEALLLFDLELIHLSRLVPCSTSDLHTKHPAEYHELDTIAGTIRNRNTYNILELLLSYILTFLFQPFLFHG